MCVCVCVFVVLVLCQSLKTVLWAKDARMGALLFCFFSGLLCVYTAALDSWWVVPCQYLWLQGHSEVVCPVANIVYAVVLQKRRYNILLGTRSSTKLGFFVVKGR